MREQRSHDCASLDWPTGPHPTPSGSGLAPTADRSKTPAAGSRSRGIDSTGPVTEAGLRGHLKNSDKDEKGGSSAYVPPDPAKDKQLIAAVDYLRSAGQGSAAVGDAARFAR